MKCYGVEFRSRRDDIYMESFLNDMTLCYKKDGVLVTADLGSLLKDMAEDIKDIKEGGAPRTATGRPDYGAIVKGLIEQARCVHDSSATYVGNFKIQVERVR